MPQSYHLYFEPAPFPPVSALWVAHQAPFGTSQGPRCLPQSLLRHPHGRSVRFSEFYLICLSWLYSSHSLYRCLNLALQRRTYTHASRLGRLKYHVPQEAFQKSVQTIMKLLGSLFPPLPSDHNSLKAKTLFPLVRSMALNRWLLIAWMHKYTNEQSEAICILHSCV